jgi:pimeloyl-ACP methyl ester carboxylesterase
VTAAPAVEGRAGGLACTMTGPVGDRSAVPWLLLHGAGGSTRHWRWMRRELPPWTPTIAVDLPGHGDSDGPMPGTLAEMAGGVRDAVTELGGGRPAAVVAHSFGGLVALQLALEHPDLVHALVLIGSAGRIMPHPELVRQLAVARADPEFFRGAFTPGLDPDRIEVVLDDLSRVRVATPAAMFATDLTGGLGGIRARTLVITARGDPVVSPRRSRALAAAIPGARTAVLEGGHYLHLERPAEVAALIQNLLTGPGSAAAGPSPIEKGASR